MLWTDVSITYTGFCSDFGRTWLVGDDAVGRASRTSSDQWRDILDAVLKVTKAGATSGDLARAAIAANGGRKPWLPHFYLGHSIGTNAAEMPMIGTDLGEEFDDNFVFPAGMVLVLEPVVWEDGTGGYRSEEIVVITEDGFVPLTDYPYAPYGDLRSCPTSGHCEAVGASARWPRWKRTTSTCWCSGGRPTSATSPGAPQLWVAGTRPFGPICTVVRSTGEIHLNSTWDEGIPDDIPHDHLYGLAWNPMTLIEVLQEHRRCGHRPTGRNRRSHTVIRQAAADGVPERRTRRRGARDARGPADQDRRRGGRPARGAARRRGRPGHRGR